MVRRAGDVPISTKLKIIGYREANMTWKEIAEKTKVASSTAQYIWKRYIQEQGRVERKKQRRTFRKATPAIRK